MSTEEFESIPAPKPKPNWYVLHLPQPRGKAGRKAAKQLTNVPLQGSKKTRVRRGEDRGLMFVFLGLRVDRGGVPVRDKQTEEEGGN